MRVIFGEPFLFITVAILTGCAHPSLVTFKDAGRENLPPGWKAGLTGSGEARWSVEEDATAPSPPYVLKQSGWTANPNYPHCVLQDAKLRDGFVEVHFKALRGTNDQAAGIVWRYHDPANYYVVRANALENNVVSYKVQQGKRQALDIVGRTGGYGVKAAVPAGQWNRLRVDFAGPRFSVRYNDEKLFSVEDATFLDAGAVGVWTKADSETVFDDFRYGACAAP